MTDKINLPEFNDNRNYDYRNSSDEWREEYKYISRLITPGASVIDLGCGNGSLIELLQKENKAACTGVEISESGVDICLRKGLNVVQGSIDSGLDFRDNEFDFAVCNVTIQMVMYPEILIKEMKRVARKQIISFPNFGFYKNRLELFLHGRMPKYMLFGYNWYSTGHIHQLSLGDFQELLNVVGGIKVVSIITYYTNYFYLKKWFTEKFPGLFMLLPIYLCEKNEK